MERLLMLALVPVATWLVTLVVMPTLGELTDRDEHLARLPEEDPDERFG